MAKVSEMKSVNQIGSLRRLVLFAGIATTMMVWTTLSDPINLPKMFVLVLLTAWVVGTTAALVIAGKGKYWGIGQWAIVAFVVGLLTATVLTDDKYEAFFGAIQRNDGALSYMALSVLAFAGMSFFGVSSAKLVRGAFLVIGGFLTFYGLIQTSGNDPMPWVLVYGPVIGTLGNPDFVSGLLGVASIASLWILFAKEQLWFRITAGVLLILELFIIGKTGSIQGFIGLGAGLTLLIIIKLWQIRKTFGIAALSAAGLGGILMLMGLLNKGPLAPRIYQTTLRNRLDYWHAAWHMFSAHPITGVGFERFGEYYFRYAPVVQIVPGQATNNAHNVFMQFLGTGGLLVMVPYIFLLGVIAWTAFRAILASRGEVQIALASLASIWIALLLVSSISIDNLGVAVWFWISGGVLYGISRDSLGKAPTEAKIVSSGGGKKAKLVEQENSNVAAPIASLVVVVVALIVMVPVWKGSADLARLAQNRDGLAQPAYIAQVKVLAKSAGRNVQSMVTLSNLAWNAQDPQLALTLAQQAQAKDPHSYYGYQFIVQSAETLGKYSDALAARKQMLIIYPREKANMLGIVKNYVQLKDSVNEQAAVKSVITTFPGTGYEDVAGAYETLSDYVTASNFRVKGLSSDPKNIDKLMPLINDYMKSNNTTAAYAVATKISTLDPESLNESMAYEMTLQFGLAVRGQLKALSVDPKNAGRILALINDYAKAGKMTEATALIPRVASLDPSGGAEAAAFEYTNQWAKALPFRQSQADKNPNDAGSLLALATDFAKLGQMDKANPLIARIQQVKPGSDQAKAAQALTKG